MNDYLSYPGRVHDDLDVIKGRIKDNVDLKNSVLSTNGLIINLNLFHKTDGTQVKDILSQIMELKEQPSKKQKLADDAGAKPKPAIPFTKQ